MSTQHTRKYNLKFKPPTHPFSLLQKTSATKLVLPTSIDLRPLCPPVYDQGDLGSCSANALCTLMEFDKIFGTNKIASSRLFLYYNERSIEGNIPTDSGAYLSDGIKSLLSTGICSELSCPYNISKFTVKPSVSCYTEALKHKAVEVFQVQQNMIAMKQCLSQGLPFCVGLQVYKSFESDIVTKTGIVPLPDLKDICLGGHAVTVVGYDDKKQQWIMRNSWGTGWGASGYFYLPYAYLTNPLLAYDMWAIKSITQK